MPMLQIRTNVQLTPDARNALLATASARTADMLGKPERYVMVEIEDGLVMAFAGSTAPLAYLELKSIGLQEAQTGTLSAALCDLVETALDVPAERIYIEFASAPRKLWGWDRGTF